MDGRPREDDKPRPVPRVVSWDEALEQGHPVLDPLGNRIHHPGEPQYEAWREEHLRGRDEEEAATLG